MAPPSDKSDSANDNFAYGMEKLRMPDRRSDEMVYENFDFDQVPTAVTISAFAKNVTA